MQRPMLRSDEIEAVYEKLAGLVNGRSPEIALVENATVAWQTSLPQHPFPNWRPHLNRQGRLRQQLHRLLADGPTLWRQH